MFAKGNPESRHATATPKKRHYRKSNILFKNKNLPFEKFGSLIRLTHYPPTKSALSDVVLLIVYGYEQLFEKPAPEEDVISETRRALSELSGQELDWRLAVLSRNVSSLDYAANCLQRGDIELINNEAGKFFQITAFGRDRAKAIIKEMQ